MQDSRKIIHIDMDAFFASVEQKDNPPLKGKAVIVGGDPTTRGVVAACSYEARRFGIHSAMPCKKAYSLCPQAIFVRPRMYRYKEISLQIMSVFREYTHLVEPLSLDEAFLDVTTNYKNCLSATLLADTIRAHILRRTGLTASAGVSYNKFLAKVASDINKPNGLSVIPPEKAMDFLSDLPINKFFGVGKVTERKMLALGIKSGRNLREYNRVELIHHFGKSGSFFYDIVRGHDPRPVQTNRNRKSIGAEKTLKHDSVNPNEIEEILSGLSLRVCEGLEKCKCGASTITLKVRYHDFTTITRSTTVNSPIYHDHDISPYLKTLLNKTEIFETPIRLLGISLSKLTTSTSRSPRQLLLPFMQI